MANTEQNDLEDFFKTPDQQEIDRAWLTQLCHDGQMADEEIDEHVEAVLKWKDKAVHDANFKLKIGQIRSLPELNPMKLKEMRKAKGLTQRDVDKQTGVSDANLSLIETGKVKSPSYDTVRKLYNLYNN